MKIIPYDRRFQQQVIALILYIQNIESKLDLSLAEQPDLSDIEAYFSVDQGAFWLSVEDERVVGTIGLKRVGSTGGILKKFFVDREYRAKGVGLQLFQAFLAFCEERHLHQIVLDTPAAATRSHSFYRKAGFQQIQKEQLPFPYSYPDRASLLFLKELQ